MIDGDLTVIYDHCSVHHVLSVGGDYEKNDNLTYDLAQLIIRVLEDTDCNPEIVVDEIKSHFAYEKEEDSDND